MSAGPSVDPTGARLDILQLLSRYAFAVDERDGDGVADCFTEDGLYASSLTGPTRGRAAIRALFAEKRERPADSRRHLIVNPYIEVDGRRATFRAYLLATRLREGRVEVALTGRYHGTVVYDGDRWRFAERHMIADGEVRNWA